MNVEPTIGLAFLAGLVSFISPCVLPLIPAYVGYMGGRATTAAGSQGSNKFETLLHGIFFVLGFTIFFVGFGLLTAAASSFLTTLGIDIPTILTRLGGVAVIFFGLYVMKALDPVFSAGIRFSKQMQANPLLALGFSLTVAGIFLGYFYWVFENVLLALLAFMLLLLTFRKALQTATSLGHFWQIALETLQVAMITDTRQIEVHNKNRSYLSSVGLGIVFSAGWTPCIGPIYGSVLTLASESAVDGGSLLPAAAMLTAYSLGLGIPFLATALALNQMTGVMRSLKRNMRKVEYASGTLLIVIGFLILTGGLEELSRRFGSDGELGDLSVRLEACTTSTANGRIQAGSWGTCVSEGFDKLNDRLIFASTKTLVATSAETSSPLLTAITPATGSGAAAVRPTPTPPVSDVPIGLAIGKRAPNILTVTPDGQPLDLEDFRGQKVLINFWATWCGPCRNEMPEFQRIYEELQDEGFTVLAVNFLEEPEAVIGFAEEMGLTFPLGMDVEGTINDSYQVEQYPTSYVLDQNGVIVAIHAGPLSGDDLLAILAKIDTGG